VFDEGAPFLEAAVIQQQRDALAGGELALAVLRLDALGVAAQTGLRAAAFQFFEDVLHGVPICCS
jgi:hypothetical protein